MVYYVHIILYFSGMCLIDVTDVLVGLRLTVDTLEQLLLEPDLLVGQRVHMVDGVLVGLLRLEVLQPTHILNKSKSK